MKKFLHFVSRFQKKCLIFVSHSLKRKLVWGVFSRIFLSETCANSIGECYHIICWNTDNPIYLTCPTDIGRDHLTPHPECFDDSSRQSLLQTWIDKDIDCRIEFMHDPVMRLSSEKVNSFREIFLVCELLERFSLLSITDNLEIP